MSVPKTFPFSNTKISTRTAKRNKTKVELDGLNHLCRKQKKFFLKLAWIDVICHASGRILLLSSCCDLRAWDWGPESKASPFEYNKEKCLQHIKKTSQSYTHMLLLLSCSHLRSGRHHLIQQICQIDLFLLHGFSGGICFLTLLSCELSVISSSCKLLFFFFFLRNMLPVRHNLYLK